MHIKTDMFCSAGIVLPDKAARILNVGGWSQSSASGLRLYSPDGSAGVNGTNDWEENPDIFRLQVGAAHSPSQFAHWSQRIVSMQSGRWYPTALVLSNGSVLVMGGENSGGGPGNPTLEILPRISGGGTQLFLDWLHRTDPNNLYPFLHILPSGLIFVGPSESLDFLPGIADLTFCDRILQRSTPS